MWAYVVPSIVLWIILLICYEWKYENIYNISIFNGSRYLPDGYNNYINTVGIFLWLGILILWIFSIINFSYSDNTYASEISFIFLDGLFLFIILLFFFCVIFRKTRYFEPDPKGNSPSPLREMRFDVA